MLALPVNAPVKVAAVTPLVTAKEPKVPTVVIVVAAAGSRALSKVPEVKSVALVVAVALFVTGTNLVPLYDSTWLEVAPVGSSCMLLTYRLDTFTVLGRLMAKEPDVSVTVT